MSKVGKSEIRVDAFDKATGRTKYYEDRMPAGALYARIKHATIAHGYVKSIDKSAAEAIEGVVKVLTCFDVPEHCFPTAGHPWSMDPGHQDVADRNLLNRHVRYYGDDIAVGAMTILSSVMQFAMLPLQGIAQGSQPITSYNYGARNSARVRQTFRLLVKVCLCYSVALWAIIQLFPGIFAQIFTPNADLVAFTVPALRVYCAALFLFGIQIACQMTFVSIGYAVCSIIVAVLRKFILLLPLIYLLPHLLADQTMAVYTAEPVADAIAVTCTASLFGVQFHKAMQKLEQEAETQNSPASDAR